MLLFINEYCDLTIKLIILDLKENKPLSNIIFYKNQSIRLQKILMNY